MYGVLFRCSWRCGVRGALAVFVLFAAVVFAVCPVSEYECFGLGREKVDLSGDNA